MPYVQIEIELSELRKGSCKVEGRVSRCAVRAKNGNPLFKQLGNIQRGSEGKEERQFYLLELLLYEYVLERFLPGRDVKIDVGVFRKKRPNFSK